MSHVVLIYFHLKMSDTELNELENLIEKRTQERRHFLKEKLHQLSSDISNRVNFNDGLPSFPDGAFQILQANNIWDTVLTYLTTPTDIRNAYYTCPTFHHSLEEKHLESTLPEVLRILHERHHLPSSYRHKRDWRNILNLRLVSPSWKEITTSEFFSTSFSSNPSSWYLQFRRESWSCFPLELHYFKDSEELDKAKALDSSSIIRNVYINSTKLNMHGLSNVISLLEIHGPSIWSLWFRGNENFRRDSDGYQVFVNSMRLLPQLKILILSYVSGERITCFFGNGNGFQNLAPPQYSLPVMENLQHFECEHVENHHVLREIFMKSSNLKSLILDRNQPISPGMAEAMQSLQLERFEDWNIMNPHGEIPRVTWPLKVLSVWNSSDLEFSRLLPVVNQFRGTLETLKFRCSVLRSVAVPPEEFNLPKLKNLHIYELNERTISVDELLPLKSLEKIVIKSCEDNALVMRRCQITMRKCDLQGSKIWQCFPYLKKIVFSDDGVAHVRNGRTVTKHFKHLYSISSLFE